MYKLKILQRILVLRDSPMNAPHRDKTLATLFAVALGGLGLHRFYLHGTKDFRA